MDNTDLVNINGKLEKLEETKELIQHMLKEQLSYVPKMELVMKNQEHFAKSIIDITKTIQKQVKDLAYADDIRLYTNKFNTGFRVFSTLVQKMKQISNVLVNALLTTNNGRIYPNLLKPEYFLEMLKNVQSNLPLEFQLVDQH